MIKKYFVNEIKVHIIFLIMVDKITTFNREINYLCVQFVNHDIREDFFCNMPNQLGLLAR